MNRRQLFHGAFAAAIVAVVKPFAKAEVISTYKGQTLDKWKLAHDKAKGESWSMVSTPNGDNREWFRKRYTTYTMDDQYVDRIPNWDIEIPWITFSLSDYFIQEYDARYYSKWMGKEIGVAKWEYANYIASCESEGEIFHMEPIKGTIVGFREKALTNQNVMVYTRVRYSEVK